MNINLNMLLVIQLILYPVTGLKLKLPKTFSFLTINAKDQIYLLLYGSKKFFLKLSIKYYHNAIALLHGNDHSNHSVLILNLHAAGFSIHTPSLKSQVPHQKMLINNIVNFVKLPIYFTGQQLFLTAAAEIEKLHDHSTSFVFICDIFKFKESSLMIHWQHFGS